MVNYLEHGLSYHVAQELQHTSESGDMSGGGILSSLERAFFMADIHSKQLGVTTSGATVAVCLIKVCSIRFSRQAIFLSLIRTHTLLLLLTLFRNDPVRTRLLYTPRMQEMPESSSAITERRND